MRLQGASQLAKDFLAVFGVLATIAGAYLAAYSLDVIWLFWLLAPLALLIVAAKWGWPRVKRAAFMLSNFGAVEQELVQVKADVNALKLKVAGHSAELDAARAAGRLEGRREIVGAVLSLQTRATLRIVGVGLRGSELVLGAQVKDGSVPPIGARYDLRFDFTGDRQGALEVIEHTQGEGDAGVLLAVVDESVPAYWQRLREQAVVNQAAPEGCSLVAPELSRWEQDDA